MTALEGETLALTFGTDMKRASCRLSFLLALVLGLAVPLAAQQKSPPKPQVAATVNGEPVYVGEIVNAKLDDIIKMHRAERLSPDVVKAELLRDVINKRLVEQVITREGAVDEAAVQKQLDKLNTMLKDSKTTLEDYAAREGVGPEVARHEIVWALAWRKYLETNLADALEGYFNDHRRDLDGTLVRASHVLLRRDRAGETNAQLIARAEKIRQEIESKKLTFEEAAQKYSVGPSRHRGGDLGFIPRRGVMHEAFASAAFALEKGEVSKPVITPFGVHLIRVTEIKPGSKQWTQVVEEIKASASGNLFERVAAQERKTAKIEYTGKLPYFKPGTDEVVVPAASASAAGQSQAKK